jgi:hypothetical protein
MQRDTDSHAVVPFYVGAISDICIDKHDSYLQLERRCKTAAVSP